MKKFTKFISLLAAVALMVSLSGINTLTVSAAEPTTYCIGYDPDDGWRWQLGNQFDSSEPSSDLYYLNEHIKDGDVIVIYSDGSEGADIRVNVRLSNVTVVGGNQIALVTANGIDAFYGINNCVAAINADVKNAYVYDEAFVTFNNNVERLEIIAEADAYNTITASAGTVGYAKAHYDGNVFYEVYNVAAGKFVSESSIVRTDAQFYSTTPSASASTGQTSSGQQTSSSGEYDDVPKTGESNMIFLLLGLSAVCFIGSRKLRSI